MHATAFALLAALLLFLPNNVSAHGEHNHQDHTDLCEIFTPKSENPMPDFSQPQWEIIKKLENGFHYTFYKDRTRPEVPVAAISVSGTIPDASTTLTRINWQVEDKIMTARAEMDEMVCVRSLYDRTGTKRDLYELMQAIEKNGRAFAPLEIPTPRREFDFREFFC